MCKGISSELNMHKVYSERIAFGMISNDQVRECRKMR